MKTFIFVVFTLLTYTSFAKDQPTLEVSEARIFAPIKGTNATAGYGIIKNISKKSLKIAVIDVESFKAAELHETVQENGRMAMHKKDQFLIEPGQSLELKQGGNHLMLFDPSLELKAGDFVQVKLKVNEKTQSFPFKVISRFEKPIPTH